MRFFRRDSFAVRLLCLLCLCSALWRKVSAQDFYHGGVSAQTAAHAGIYSPDSGNALDALALNPAGLAALTGIAGNAMLSTGLARGTFSDAANDDSRMRLRPGFVPFGGVGGRLGGRWSGGFAITPDFLSAVNWHYADSPGTGGADYGSQAEKSEILAYRGSAGVAFSPSPRLSLGVSAGTVYNENMLIAPFIFQSNPDLKGLKTLLALHTRGFGWGGSVGLTASPARTLALSAAWSSPIVVNSRGHASGNMGEQFAALGIPFLPDFTYRARVRVKLPQSLFVGVRWRASHAVGVSLQGDYANFHSAFDKLPVSLSNGSNPDINSFLHSSSILDEIPLRWSDQYTARVAVDRSLGEHYQLSGGYARRSSLVPNGTLTPLTAAIMKNGLSGGLACRHGRLQAAGAYSINLNQSAQVGTSGLLAGEYSHSKVVIGTQALVLETSLRWR